MKNKHALVALMLSAAPLCAQNTVTLVSEDFESGGNSLNRGNNGLDLVLAANPDPAGSGMVGQGDSSKVATQWGALLTIPGRIPLPAGAEPGVSTYTISMMVYIPSGTTFAADDRMGIIVRWNGLQTSANANYVTIDTFTPDTWQPITLDGIIPALDGDGNAVTEALPIISFNDRNDDAIAGVSAYIDDYSFEVSVSEDDPNFPIPPQISFGDIDQDGGPHTKNLILANGGTSNTLTITAADLGGADADFFSLSDLTLPLNLAPGESQIVQVTVDPGSELGTLAAEIAFTSNDPTTPIGSTFLNANSVEAFVGKELIINGDFETGNAEGWREDNRFTYSEEFSRSGNGSGVFTMSAGQQWGEARQSATALVTGEQGTFDITPEMIGKDYFYSGWYYRPSTDGPADNDTVQLILRWNAKNGATNHTDGQKMVGTLPTDTWVRFSLAGIIPDVDLDGLPVDHFTALWSFQDVGSDSMGTETMFIDDISFKVDIPFDQPVVPLAITNLKVDLENNRVSFDYSATPGMSYAIDRSTTLLPSGEPGGWLEIEETLLATDVVETYIDNGAPSTSPIYFYRVRIAEE